MSPLMIAQLVIALGPTGLSLARELAELWSKPTLTIEEVNAICGKAEKSYDEYIAEAQSKVT